MRLMLHIFLAFFLAAQVMPATAQTISECQCLDCLKLWKLSAQAEMQAHLDRWQKARKSMQTSIDHYNSSLKRREQMARSGQTLFCDLWGTLNDEKDLLRDYDLPAIQRQIFGNSPHCLVAVSGSTDPYSCKIDDAGMVLIEMTSPCPQIHLSILAHELAHVRDCKAREVPSWADATGSSCNEAFKGKTPPPPEEVLRFAESFFLTEVNAYEIEARVERLFAHELTLLCRPDDYSSRMTLDDATAIDFLQRARAYQYQIP